MNASLEALVEFLFKYRPVAFERGELVLGASGGARLLAMVLGAVALAAVAALLTRRVRGRPRDRAVIGVLRFLVIAVLVLCLFQPQLVIAEAVSRGNVVAVLVDDSRSMTIPDRDGRTRAQTVREALDGESGLLAELEQRFQVRLYSFGRELRRIRTTADLGFDQPRTDYTTALESVRSELDGLPLAGVILMSDGGDVGGGSLGSVLASIRAADVPVFTVLAGGEPERDVRIASVAVPPRAVRGSAVDARVSLDHRGLAGRTVQVLAEDEGRVVATSSVVLPRSGRASVSLPVPLREDGARRLRFRVAAVESDQVPDNDGRLSIVQVDARPRRVLYYEGEPRPEASFVRQAVSLDRELEVVLLQRTADDKYLRLGVRAGSELEAGFPTTREELFEYDALILGSVEASAFTFEQLRMIEDYVDVRGGGLLLLGGRRALAEGGYAGTPLAALSPVELPSIGPANILDTLAPRLTRDGREHAAVQLAAPADMAEARWRELPAVTVVNRVGLPKPGAVTLLAGTPGQQPLLSYHRFGSGRVALLLPQDSWIWQMHADIPLEDQTHETFWRQLLRWLAGDTPERLTGTVPLAVAEAGETVSLVATFRDERFVPLGDGIVTATVTSPGGMVYEEVLVSEGGGRFSGVLEPDEEGLWQARISASGPLDGADSSARNEHVAFAVERSAEEFYDVTPHREALARISSVTRGRGYDIARASALPRDLVYASSGMTTREHRDLWDAPAVLLALLGLLSAEWGYRRWRGLA